jgi:SAM-dependent methyltransferase/predicted O-methyltransferase YrrM
MITSSIKTKYHSFDEYALVEATPGLAGEVATQLMWMYRNTVEKSKPVVLELGTDQGMATTVFLQACEEKDGTLVSVDIADCSDVSGSPKWQFVQSDSVNVDYILSKAPHLNRGIDILYIDSLHTPAHVRKELTGWYPYLNAGSWIFFDDVDSHPYRKGNRKDNRSAEVAWDQIHDFVKCFFYANENSLQLNILYGSTGLACLRKLSPRGTIPANANSIPHRTNSVSLAAHYSGLLSAGIMRGVLPIARSRLMKGISKYIRSAVNRGIDQGDNRKQTPRYEIDSQLGIKRRSYDSYGHYLAHQAEKLAKVGEPLLINDQLYEQIVAERYSHIDVFSGKNVICLGARLGGEVRAFKSLGALAIGIDLEPGPNNSHVVYGDFHNIPFAEESFDIAFTNALDHVFDLERFLDEVDRVLSPGGFFYVELGRATIGNYEVLDMQDLEPLLKVLRSRFQIEWQKQIRNKTNYVDWEGLLVKLQRVRFQDAASNR